MLIIADSRIPVEAKKKLNSYGEVIFLESSGITYDAISGHPDIFICNVNDQWIIAPNLPSKYKQLLEKKNISFTEGEQPVGSKYPATAGYNVAATHKFLFHNFRYTDSKISQAAGDLDLIHISQGYSRCNLLPLKDDHFITSDEGIGRVLENYKLHVLYVHPTDILLPGVKHGFFGGCCGILGDQVFIIGRLDHYGDGEKVRNYLSSLHYEVIELYNGPLFDGGSVMFL